MINKLFKDEKTGKNYYCDSEFDNVLWEEVPENKIPKKIRNLRPQGAGTIENGYLKSNTYGETNNKVFTMVGGLPAFIFKEKERLKEFDNAHYGFVEVEQILKNILNRELEFRGFKVLNNLYRCEDLTKCDDDVIFGLRLKTKYEDFIPEKSKLEKYSFYNEMLKEFFEDIKFNSYVTIEFYMVLDKNDAEIFKKLRLEDTFNQSKLLNKLLLKDFKWVFKFKEIPKKWWLE